MPAHQLHARHARMHDDHPFAHQLDERAADPDVKTVISVVYYTAPKTFDGPAVYVTDPLTVPSGTSSADSVKAAENTAQATKGSNDDDDDEKSATKASAKSTGTTLATQTINPSKTASASSQITSAADVSSTASLKLSQATSAAAVASASSTAAAAGSSDSGLSGGAKAGMAFAIICFIALLAFLAFFYKKKQQEKKQVPADDENEKFDEKRAPPPMAQSNFNNSTNGVNQVTPISAVAAMKNSPANERPASSASRSPSVRTVKTAGNAPRLSLRPMTQFAPLTQQKGPDGDILDTPGPSPWERRGAANAANDPTNPFGNHAETVDMATARDAVELGTPTTPMTPAIEFPLPVKIAPTSAPTSVPTSAPTSAPAAPEVLGSGAFAPGNPKALKLTTDVSGPAAVQSPNPFADQNVPPSPGPAPTGALPGAPGSNDKPVHRCHMDFAPSMSDELGVTNGQLVRLMHEYDDGWTLCQKMDGSQQGVVPRSCLSKQPLKARPGPPPGARPPMGPHQGSPMGPPRARRPSNASGKGVPPPGQAVPMSPAQAIPMSPATGRNSPGPRPMQPAQGPPQGSPQGRNRAQSNASYAGPLRPMSPAGGRNSPGPRAMSPMNPAGDRQRSHSNASFNAPRPQFAQESQRPRANSLGQVAGRNSPSGPSPMNPAPAPAPLANAAMPPRKPIVGQAS